MKYVFLINTYSLKEDAYTVIDSINRVAMEKNLDYVIETNSIDNQTEKIMYKYKDSENIIMCIGGDGTINRTLNSIVGTKNILGYIPYGTGNDFYRTNKELLENGINEIDLIKINGRYFINVACFGIDADIANTEEIVHSKLIPKSQRYNASIVKNFFSFVPRYMQVVVDDQEYNGRFTTLAVCNARYYGGGYKIGPNALLDDGLLDVYLVDEMSKLKMAKLLLGMKKGKHEKDSLVKVIKTKKVYVNTYKDIRSNIDGDVLTDRIFNIEVIPKGIKVYYDQELIDEIKKDRNR